MAAPALLVAVPFLGGAAVALLFVVTPPGTSAALCAGAAVIGLIAACGASASDERDPTFLMAVTLTAAAAGVSLGLTEVQRVHHTSLGAWLAAFPAGTMVTLHGRLMDDAAVTPLGASMAIAVEGIEAAGPLSRRLARIDGGVRLSVAGALQAGRVGEWRAGRRLRVPAFVRPPPTYVNPGTPDERPALARRGIVAVGSVKSAALVEIVERGGPIAEAAASIRATVRRRIGERIGDRRAAGIATAILVGDRSGLAEEDERRLQDAGTYHVVAISGGNIAILALLVAGTLRVLMVPRAAGALVACAVLLGYGAVAGGAASVFRAIAVAVLVLAARSLDHRVHPINVLASVAILAVAVTPAAVLDPGFHLSFGATLGILLGLRHVAAGPPDGHGPVSRLGRAGVRLLAATLCAEAALIPVSATLFGRVPFAGLLLNFAAIPLMTVVQVGGLVLALAPPAAAAALRLTAAGVDASVSVLFGSAALVEWAPWLVHDVHAPVWWLVLAYYGSALAALRHRSRRVAIPAFIGCLVLMLTGPRATSRDAVGPSPSPLRVVVMDVGQGDATAVTLPGGRALLVDAGGVAALSSGPDGDLPPAFDIGERVVSRVLRALGFRRLDGLVLTHGDPDHILGARGVIAQVPPGAIWEGVPVPPHGGLRQLRDLAAARGISWRTVQAGDTERFGDVEVRVLHPPLPDWERQRVRNEDSIVLELRLGTVSIILPGDIGREAEHLILPRLEPGRTVILKAPHHGSATSSTKALLDALHPAAVIVSAGRHNRFGHPHPTVVQRYRAMGTAIFSTAEDGAVFVETDGKTVTVKGWLGRARVFPAR